ncbi:probable CCR4-associated factor 1 homolog 11 [Quercus suber]|uniref:poly(A)-specific ribonuclease n=1 Tax=Quercus suber TaxID=58331 RepID=A0AAW0IQM6_QUESU|nr:probable CCR4-associated factor 1 homolog 11 [Quercus suber]POE97000.1 putative ccr4-associated factor 1 like 11 [Quercus suber]
MDHAVIVRKVWKENLVKEFDLVKVALMSYRMVSIDTEFPGIVYGPANVDKHNLGKLPPIWNYQVIRDNVNSSNIIQLGLALCDDKGSLPHFGTGCQYVWEFNFNNFDVYNDLQNPESIELLEHQGIDFDKNLKEGIDSADFAPLMLESGLLGDRFHLGYLSWCGAYNIAHLMKILIRQPLPMI